MYEYGSIDDTARLVMIADIAEDRVWEVTPDYYRAHGFLAWGERDAYDLAHNLNTLDLILNALKSPETTIEDIRKITVKEHTP